MTTRFKGPLIPPQELAPPRRAGTTAAQSIKRWLDVMDACDAFVRGGLRREVGPDGDLAAAYRDWYRRHMEQHDQTVRQMLERMDRSWRNDDRQRSD